jgi:hypothetical protein
MSRGVRVLSTEDWPDAEDTLPAASDFELFIELPFLMVRKDVPSNSLISPS